MPIPNSADVVNLKLPGPRPVTEKAIEVAKKYSHLFRGSVRAATGRIKTTQKLEEMRRCPLP